MATPPMPNFQVVINSLPYPPQHVASNDRRPFSVDKALQYTPLTTSVIPACDRIPLPQIRRPKQTSRISTSAERKAIQRSLTNGALSEVKDKINLLLNADSLAKIKFKRPLITPDNSPSHPASFQNGPSRHLSSTAKMVLDIAQIEYEYPTPSPSRSQRTPSPESYSQARTLPTPAVSRSPEIRSLSEMKVGQNSSTLPLMNATPIKHNFTLGIPRLPAARLKDYAAGPGSPKRQKLDNDERHASISLHLRAERDVTDKTLLELQDLLVGLFEAQDQLESNSLASEVEYNEYFDLSDEDENTSLRISIQLLNQLQSSLKRLVNFKRLNDISSDHLRRLQRICEISVEASSELDLKIGYDANEDEQNEWRSRVSKAENGALAACTILWTMLGNQKDDDLVPEDIFKWVPNVLTNIFEKCLIPFIEARPETRAGDGKESDLFELAIESKEPLRRLLEAGKRLLDLAATICVRLKDTEGAMQAIQFLAAKLIFAQNGSSDKNSALGFQTYEKIKKTAMTVLAQIYARFPAERAEIVREILTSLDKLPSTSRSARQYKVAEGKNIQLVTALLMLLVQTTTMEAKQGSDTRRPELLSKMDQDSDMSDEENNNPNHTDGKAQGCPNHLGYSSPLEQLQEVADRLCGDGAKSAHEIVHFLVQRASSKNKPGRTNDDNSREITADYRNFLDFFVEDLLSVLSSPDWPAAELILRTLVSRMLTIAQFDKAASTKNMALEILGQMGSTISTLRASVNGLINGSARDDESQAHQILFNIAQEQSLGSLRIEDLLGTSGPFMMTYQSLQSSNDKGLRADSARGFFVVQWAKLLCQALVNLDNDDAIIDTAQESLIRSLNEQISDTSLELLPGKFHDKISGSEGRLAYTLTILNLKFCRSFEEIVKTLVAAFKSDQAQVRSRSIKSVVSILEIDSTLLDRDTSITDEVFACASDDSAMVRDAALSLIAKSIVARPSLEEKGIRRLLECAADSKVGVQKRAIGHLRDIYLRDSRQDLQAAIAETLLQRLQDPEESVSKLAMQTLLEIWIDPYLSTASSSDSAAAKFKVQVLAIVIVRTISRGVNELPTSLAVFFSTVVKKSAQHKVLCSNIVAQLFDQIISEDDGSPKIDKQAFLLTLKICAQANPLAISPDQLQALRPYLGNLVKTEDLNFFKPVVAIFRCVLPNLSGIQQPLLKEIQADLMKTVAKLMRRTDLDEVMACLWTIDGVLQNTDKLATLAISVLNKLQSGSMSAESETQLVRILGAIGKQWNLESQLPFFTYRVSRWSGSSVASFMADLVCSFVGPTIPAPRRAVALESLGSIFQAWPMECNKPRIWESFLKVFEAHAGDEQSDSLLQVVVLTTFAELLGGAENDLPTSRDDDVEKEQAIGDMGGDEQSRQLAIVMGQISQRFLAHILQAALTTRSDNKALVATKVIAGINRQGLGHPKDCLGAMVALESGIDQVITKIAHDSHEKMHLQHAVTYQRGYVEAVEIAFKYHRDVYNDVMGCFRPGHQAKLLRCFEVVSNSTTKYVKSFLVKLVDGATRDILKSEVSYYQPYHLLLARFIFQNLAFFTYGKVDELLHLILYLETELSKRGPEIVQTIESTLDAANMVLNFAPLLDGETSTAQFEQSESSQQKIPDPEKLRAAATGATILFLLWETRSFLKRQYGVSGDVRNALNKIKKDKEGGKPALKVHGITGERYFDRCLTLVSSLEDADNLEGRCQEFQQLMAIDDEVRVGGDEDGMRELHSASLDIDENAIKLPGSGRARKRKNSASVGGTPQKRRGRPALNRSRRSSSSSEDPNADFTP